MTDPDALPARPAWEVVQLARNLERPNTLEYIGYIFDDFKELNGDRLFDQDGAIVGGVGRLGNVGVVVLGHQKGHTTGEMMERNFGMPNPEGYRKGMRLMQHATKFRMPLVTFVDTPGAYPGLGAEERGQSIAIAESIMMMSRIPVPIVTIVTGEGRQRRCARSRGWRPRSDDGELVLLGDQPRGLLDDPVQGRHAGAARCGGASADWAPTCSASGSWTASCRSQRAGAHAIRPSQRQT